MKSIEWKPYGARLIVKRVVEYEGTLIIPQSVKQASMMCEVVSVGGLCGREYKIGDRLLLGRYSGYDVPVLAREYIDCMIVNEEYILCYAED